MRRPPLLRRPLVHGGTEVSVPTATTNPNLQCTLAKQVANTLAPLSHSASAPVTSLLDTSAALASDDAANPANPRPGSGRLVLSDDIAAKRNR